jgi:hypothetical protein
MFKIKLPPSIVGFFVCLFFGVTDVELRALCLLCRYFYHLSHSSSLKLPLSNENLIVVSVHDRWEREEKEGREQEEREREREREREK